MPASGAFVPAGYGQATQGSRPRPKGPTEAELAAWYAGASQPAPTSGGDSGGSSSGGSDFTAYTAPAPRLDEDPGWLEYSRQTDLSVARANADLARRRGLIESDRDRVLGELEPQGEQQREGIMGNFASRGLFHSGALERDVARQRAAQAQRAGSIQAGAAGQIGDIESDVAARIADLNAQRAIQQATLRAQGYA